MTVQELIEKLSKVENKEIPITWCKASEDSKKLGDYEEVEFSASFVVDEANNRVMMLYF